MTPFVSAGAGFLLAVLWFDLMFDVQGWRHRAGDVPEPVLASIAGYYRRVTTTARPMNRLVAAVMLATVAAIAVQLATGDAPAWVGWASLVVAGVPVVLAGTRTVPNAVRLGTRRDPVEHQRHLARTIFAQHLCCAAAIGALLVLQLAFAR
jgi:hypothetical protein